MRAAIILIMLCMLFTGCKKGGYYDTGAILVDEVLIESDYQAKVDDMKK